jgi:hypothetical protein
LDDVTARNAAQVRDWSGRYLRPGRGAAAIDMDSARGDIEFWGWLARGGVSGELRLVLVTDERRAAIVDMFAAGRNPTMIWNIRAVLNAELLNFAKQKSVKVGKVALVVHNASLPVTVSVFAPSKRIPILLQQAFEHATLSAEYVRDNCVPRVRPIERVDWDYFRAVQTRGAVVFRNAIKRGMARPKDPKVQWPALASVELIAAIGGRPPQVFDEADRSLDAEVHKWLRKPPTIDADLKESAIVYLKRLRKNAPSVAKLTWETDGARNAWLGALDDLNRRLGSGST